ncbi:FecR family protein [Mangrovibacterium lignilyticum]|uniref:FecR family protein n=1 Tax=Mangrovibacterium lignilyticum TaxID=2668052 RepID=UPI0013D15235|nr:FecR domain-containing protein [Mangrovibacterium lignilyticum]
MNLFLKNYLNNTCDEKELDQLVDQFQDPDKKEELEQDMLEDWVGLELNEESPDLRSALYRIHYHINKIESKGFGKRRIIHILTRGAAVLFVPLMIAFLLQLLSTDSITTKTISTPLAAQTTFKLPDGTQVWLNSGSSLAYPDEFSGNTRRVELHGEAYFDVTKSKTPFIVDAGSCNIKVLGTAFNVFNYDNELPVVTLDRGKVSIVTGKDEKILTPGFQAVVDTSSQFVSLKKVDAPTYSLWRKHQLVFQDEELDKVAVKLERWYNVDIEIADSSLLGRRMTANIEYESLTEVLDLMQVTMPIEYSFNKETRKLVLRKH